MGGNFHPGFESLSLRHYKGIRSIWVFSDWPFFLVILGWAYRILSWAGKKISCLFSLYIWRFRKKSENSQFSHLIISIGYEVEIQEFWLFTKLSNVNINFKYERINSEVLSLLHEYRPGFPGVSPNGLSIGLALISYFGMPAQSLFTRTGIVAWHSNSKILCLIL